MKFIPYIVLTKFNIVKSNINLYQFSIFFLSYSVFKILSRVSISSLFPFYLHGFTEMHNCTRRYFPEQTRTNAKVIFHVTNLLDSKLTDNDEKVEVISPLHIFLLFTLNIWIYTFLIIRTFICENAFFKIPSKLSTCSLNNILLEVLVFYKT